MSERAMWSTKVKLVPALSMVESERVARRVVEGEPDRDELLAMLGLK